MRAREGIEKIPGQLAELTGLSIVETVREPSLAAGTCRADLIVRTGEKAFVVEFKDKAAAEAVGAGIRTLKRCLEEDDGGHVPLLVVPYMWDVGRRLCEESGIAWMDLSGNASIHAPGLHVTVEGRPNRFVRRGRPRNLFAPKASRIARALLVDPGRARRQRDLVAETGLTKGYVSKVVTRLEDASLVQRDDAGRVRARDPDLLLDAWSEAYEFAGHRIHSGHMASRSPEESLARLVETLGAGQTQFAATGLAAAWKYSKHAAYRLVTVYVDRLPGAGILDSLGFRETASGGSNTWLAVPDDEGVFHGKRRLDGVWCVSPVQVYLDLLGHPERAQEAARALRRECLSWTDGRE